MTIATTRPTPGLKPLAIYCWGQIEEYQRILLDPGHPDGYYAFVRGKLAAYRAVLVELERIEEEELG